MTLALVPAHAAAAVHEAAHGCAALLLGVSVQALEVTDQGTGICHLADFGAVDCEDLAVILLAGDVANTRLEFEGRQGLDPSAAESDRRRARLLLDSGQPRWRLRLDVLRCELAAGRLVDHHWQTIREVGRQLASRRRLTGDELRALAGLTR